MDNQSFEGINMQNNTNESIKNDSTANKGKEKPKKAKHTKNNLIGTLKYGIAALSLVSFITTSNGLREIMKEDRFTPFLISFGIQMIVLIVGTQLVNILKFIIKRENSKRIVQGVIAISVVIPYLSAVCFSSFFSYVYLANSAYDKVKESDYNIEIENYFNEEIMQIKTLNDAAGNIILKQIQSCIPDLKNILSEISAEYDGDIESAKNQMVKNSTSSLDSSKIYNPETYIYSFGANSEQAERLRAMKRNLIAQHKIIIYIIVLTKNSIILFKMKILKH